MAVDRGVVAAGAAYPGGDPPGPNAPWLQLCEPGRDAPSHDAAGVVYRVGERWHPMPTARARAGQLLGLLLASRRDLEDAIVYALERGFDLLVLDGTGALGGEWPELRAPPDPRPRPRHHRNPATPEELDWTIRSLTYTPDACSTSSSLTGFSYWYRSFCGSPRISTYRRKNVQVITGLQGSEEERIEEVSNNSPMLERLMLKYESFLPPPCLRGPESDRADPDRQPAPDM